MLLLFLATLRLVGPNAVFYFFLEEIVVLYQRSASAHSPNWSPFFSQPLEFSFFYFLSQPLLALFCHCKTHVDYSISVAR